MTDLTIKDITDDINERMATHVNSMCATEDEVSIAWLLWKIDEQQKVIDEVHDWAVCGAIASPEDMCQNLDRIVEITTPEE